MEWRRRIAAACLHYGIDYESVCRSFYFITTPRSQINFAARLASPRGDSKIGLPRSTLETEAEMTEGKTRKPDAVHPGWLPGDNPRYVRLIGSSADLEERHEKFAIRTIAVF